MPTVDSVQRDGLEVAVGRGARRCRERTARPSAA